MWLSRKMAVKPSEEAGVGGVVSVGGENPAVVTDGESRTLEIIAPGGYIWRPDVNQRVLLWQGNVMGAVQSAEKLAPGEILLYSNGASVRLGNDGSIHLKGDVFINGERWEPIGSGTA